MKYQIIASLIFASSMTISSQAKIVLVEGGRARAQIIIPKDAPDHTRSAAERLADYLKRASGVPFSITDEAVKTSSMNRIWVGFRPEIREWHPEVDPATDLPEEILIQALDHDLIILGRDRVEEGVQIEAGTYHAVSTFLEERLNVRWFWPGPLGTDVPFQETIAFDPFVYRYHPKLRWRVIPMQLFERSRSRLANPSLFEGFFPGKEEAKAWALKQDAQVREWMNNQRSHTKAEQPLAGTMNYWGMHYFGKRQWWKRFGEEHPQWFAMQPDGSRTPYPDGERGKMCVTNPGVAQQWLAEASERFDNDQHIKMVAAAENDFGWQGYCVCPNCLAADNRDAPLLEKELIWATERKPFYALTDRYVKFWNQLAVALKKRYPEREANVSIWAYHATKPAPTIALEKNVIVGFVGVERRFYEENDMQTVSKDREIWKQWWEASGRRDNMVWRPNLMARNVGGMPYVFMHRHGENMVFLADHGLGGIHWNSLTNHWATQGPQHYVNARLAWNPYLKVDAVLDDYYLRAFGPAAAFIKDYFALCEEQFRLLAEQYKGVTFSMFSDPPKIFREIRKDGARGKKRLGEEGIARNDDFEEEAQRLLDAAARSVQGADEVFGQRVGFITTGFRFVQAQLDSIQALNDLRENKGNPAENRARLNAAVKRRLELLRNNRDNFAIDLIDVIGKVEKYGEFLGPLTDEASETEEPEPKDAPTDEKALKENLEA